MEGGEFPIIQASCPFKQQSPIVTSQGGDNAGSKARADMDGVQDST